MPAEPARPPSAPHNEYRTKGSSLKITLHGIAHAEGYAIDLMWDLIARFAGTLSPQHAHAFTSDWLRIAAEEAVHFERWSALLHNVFGVTYGDLPSHAGLWEAAAQSADHVLARLALVHMVHEARGLDTSDASLARIEAFEQTEGLVDTIDTEAGKGGSQGGPCAATLRQNVNDEVGHVACAVHWFEVLCHDQGIHDTPAHFRTIVSERLKGGLKPPFDTNKRDRANMSRDYYQWAVNSDETDDASLKQTRRALKAVEREQRLLEKVVAAQQARMVRLQARVARLDNSVR